MGGRGARGHAARQGRVRGGWRKGKGWGVGRVGGLWAVPGGAHWGHKRGDRIGTLSEQDVGGWASLLWQMQWVCVLVFDTPSPRREGPQGALGGEGVCVSSLLFGPLRPAPPSVLGPACRRPPQVPWLNLTRVVSGTKPAGPGVSSCGSPKPLKPTTKPPPKPMPLPSLGCPRSLPSFPPPPFCCLRRQGPTARHTPRRTQARRRQTPMD